MDFQDLHAFMHVARQGSFSRAAVSLRTAQSALSRRVLRLEHSLGVTLLERYARGVRVTRAGEILLHEAGELIERLERIEDAMGNLAEEPAGELRLALPPTTGQILGPVLVSECRRLYPRLVLHLREGFSGSIHHWIGNDEVDMAVLYDPEPSSDFVIRPLLREPLYLVAPARLPESEAYLADVRDFRVRDLARLPLIMPSRSHSIRVLIERYAAEHGFRLNIVTQVDGIRTTKGLVEAGLGYTVFSYAGVYEEIDAGTLRAIPLAPSLSWTMAIVHKAHAPSVLLQSLRTLIEQQVHVLSEGGFWRGELVD